MNNDDIIFSPGRRGEEFLKPGIVYAPYLIEDVPRMIEENDRMGKISRLDWFRTGDLNYSWLEIAQDLQAIGQWKDAEACMLAYIEKLMEQVINKHC